MSTVEAFYQLFLTLSEEERLSIIQYILNDTEVQRHFDELEIPNKTTLKAFSEDKLTMPAFHSAEELRRDLLS